MYCNCDTGRPFEPNDMLPVEVSAENIVELMTRAKNMP